MSKFSVFFIFAISLVLSACAGQKKVVFVSGNSVHLWGDHEHAIMCETLTAMVNESMGESVRAEWLDTEKTSDFKTLDDADAIILVSEGENNHPFDSKTGILKRQNDRGANIGAFHYALMFNGDSDNAALDSLIGGHYQKGFSYNPFYEAFFDVKNTHPILNGVKPFGYYDEWHFNIKFANDKSQKLTPLIKTKVPDKIRKRRSAPKEVQAELGKNRFETVAWVVENGNGTRGFGIMGGHVPWTLAQKDYRKLVLNMVAWLAEAEIPANGFDATMPPFDALAAKIKKQKRGDYQYYIKDWKDADAKWRREK